MTTLREAYDLIDRFLRNNLYDDDYADYSEALELLSSEPPQQQAAPFSPDSISTAQTAWKMGYEAAKAEMAEQAQPVAWMCSDEELLHKGYSRFSKTCVGEWNIPVYTHPPQRKPLTDEALNKIIGQVIGWNSAYGPEESFARAIERAHGIGGEV